MTIISVRITGFKGNFKNFGNFSLAVVVVDKEPAGHLGDVDVEVKETIVALLTSVDRSGVAGQDVADGATQRRDAVEMHQLLARQFKLSQIFLGSGCEHDFEIGFRLDPTWDPNLSFFF